MNYKVIEISDVKNLDELPKRELNMIKQQDYAYYMQKTKKYVEKINEISSYISVTRFILSWI